MSKEIIGSFLCAFSVIVVPWCFGPLAAGADQSGGANTYLAPAMKVREKFDGTPSWQHPLWNREGAKNATVNH